MKDFVLDAWAVMVWLKGQQPAAEQARLLLDAADRGERTLIMNIVNLGEVFSRRKPETWPTANVFSEVYASVFRRSLRAMNS